MNQPNCFHPLIIGAEICAEWETRAETFRQAMFPSPHYRGRDLRLGSFEEVEQFLGQCFHPLIIGAEICAANAARALATKLEWFPSPHYRGRDLRCRYGCPWSGSCSTSFHPLIIGAEICARC